MTDARSTQNRSLTHAGVLMFVSNTGAGVIVYALQVAMGRLLSVADYGLFTALFGVFNIAATSLAAVLLIVIRNVARELSAGQLAGAAAVRDQAVREALVGGSILVAAGVALSPFIAKAMDSPSAVPVILMWFGVGANLSMALAGSVLQGMQRFGSIAVVNLATPLVRLVLCAGLVLAGWGMAGAMGGLVVSAVAGAAAFWTLVDRRLPRHSGDGSTRPLLRSGETLRLAANSLAFVALTQIDYVVVRVFCTPDQAGTYSAGAVLAKSVLWLPVGITLALVPTVAWQARSPSEGRHLLRQALLMALAVSGLLSMVLAIWAPFWIRTLYGPEFAASAVYLRWLSLIYLPLALVLVVDNFFLALRRVRFVLLYIFGATLQVVVFLVPGHQVTPDRVVLALAVASAACAFWAIVVTVPLRGRPGAQAPATDTGDHE
jgi:O-antigen/teichoic acid export membrane protein